MLKYIQERVTGALTTFVVVNHIIKVKVNHVLIHFMNSKPIPARLTQLVINTAVKTKLPLYVTRSV